MSYGSSQTVNGQQVTQLCDDLNLRAQTARQEEELLGDLVRLNGPTRRFRSRQYQALLEDVSARLRAFQRLIDRYCRHADR